MRSSKLSKGKSRRKRFHMRSTGARAQKNGKIVEPTLSNTSGGLPAEFVARLGERSCGTLSYADFVRTAGEFIVVREGKVVENDPHTRMARRVLSILSNSAERSKSFFARKKAVAGR